ncbi:MAG TPA: biotin--[acetyl-CoA-carboxylase] ligase [Solirubrobacterales bacterium]|nr:biotin--[acetyl-CoA-carboxylase] ligase [Solirubrobacterales bacterium]
MSAFAFGYPRRHFAVTDSTNARARELAAAGAPGGTVVTAGRQTAGRGRRGRRWAAPAGKALLYSAILRPLASDHALLPLAAPVAVCEAVESLAPVRCAIKWPNDVWIDERKAAGVLIEARIPDWAVIGVGVNVAVEPGELPGDLRWPATSIGHGVGVEELRSALDHALGEWVAAPRARIVSAFSARDLLRGRRVAWDDGEPRSGVGGGIDEDGNLVVRLDGGGRAVLGAGEVSLALG